MRIEDRFTVALPLAEAWEVLRDVERIAPCMPGAQLTEIEGDEYRGLVKIKLGAITAQYKGAVRFAEVDEAAHRMVLAAKGRETRGQGNASADVVVTLVETDAGTEVAIETDLKITGRIAQFGRGVLADVSSKLLGEFARCLEADLTSSGQGGPAGGVDGDTGGDTCGDTITGAGDGDGENRTPAPPLPGGGEAAGVKLSGAETTASEATGFETTGEGAMPDPDAAAPAAAGPDANGSSASPAPVDPEAVTPARPPLRSVPSQPTEPLDLLALAGPGMAERALPVALVVDLVLLAVVRRPAARWLLSAGGTALVAALALGSRRSG